MRWYRSLGRGGDITVVRRRGKRAAGRQLSGYAAAQDGGPSQIAVTVGKGVGGAVVRNLTRRRIQGALDRMKPLDPALRVVLVAHPGAAAQPYAMLERDVERTVTRLAAAART